MKKTLLAIAMMSTALTSQAQSFYDTFENHEGWEDIWQSQNADKIEIMPVENPLKDATNSSDWVMMWNRMASSTDAVQRKFSATPLDMGEGDAQFQYIHFKLYSPKMESIRIKFYEEGNGAEVAFKDIYWDGYPEYDLNNGWADVSIWFGDATAYDGTPLNNQNITKIAIRPNNLDSGEGYVTYIDDLYFTVNQDDQPVEDGIANIRTNSDAQAVYTISGMKTNAAQKGIYIVNGKKIVK